MRGKSFIDDTSHIWNNPSALAVKKSLSLERNRLGGTKCLSAQIALVQYWPRHDLRLRAEGSPFSSDSQNLRMEHKANMLWIPPDSTYNINQVERVRIDI